MLRALPASHNRPDPGSPALTQEIAALYDDIRALLDEPASEEGPRFRARLEHTLTDGYARALELEAESKRIERRVAALAEGLNRAAHQPAAAARMPEISSWIDASLSR